MLSQSAAARFAIPGYELVYTAPVETALQADDLRNTAEVWREMFDAAKTRIDLGQFYVANQDGSLLDGVLQHLKAAGERGVKIRFLVEEKGIRKHDRDARTQVALWKRDNREALKQWVKGMIMLEPDDAKRAAAEEFAEYGAKFWGYPILVATDEATGRMLAQTLLSK